MANPLVEKPIAPKPAASLAVHVGAAAGAGGRPQCALPLGTRVSVDGSGGVYSGFRLRAWGRIEHVVHFDSEDTHGRREVLVGDRCHLLRVLARHCIVCWPCSEDSVAWLQAADAPVEQQVMVSNMGGGTAAAVAINGQTTLKLLRMAAEAQLGMAEGSDRRLCFAATGKEVPAQTADLFLWELGVADGAELVLVSLATCCHNEATSSAGGSEAEVQIQRVEHQRGVWVVSLLGIFAGTWLAVGTARLLARNAVHQLLLELALLHLAPAQAWLGLNMWRDFEHIHEIRGWGVTGGAERRRNRRRRRRRHRNAICSAVGLLAIAITYLGFAAFVWATCDTLPPSR